MLMDRTVAYAFGILIGPLVIGLLLLFYTLILAALLWLVRRFVPSWERYLFGVQKYRLIGSAIGRMSSIAVRAIPHRDRQAHRVVRVD